MIFPFNSNSRQNSGGKGEGEWLGMVLAATVGGGDNITK